MPIFLDVASAYEGGQDFGQLCIGLVRQILHKDLVGST